METQVKTNKVQTMIAFFTLLTIRSIHLQIAEGLVTWMPEASTIDKIDNFDMIGFFNSDHCGKFA